jgi:hypothetical protein
MKNSLSVNEFYSAQSNLSVSLTCTKVHLDQLSSHYSSLRQSTNRFVPPIPSWIFPRQFFSPSQPERVHTDRLFHLVAASSALQRSGLTRPSSPTDEPGTVRVALAAPGQPLFDMFIDQPITQVHSSEKWMRLYVNCRWSGRAEQPDQSCAKWLSRVREWHKSAISRGTK